MLVEKLDLIDYVLRDFLRRVSKRTKRWHEEAELECKGALAAVEEIRQLFPPCKICGVSLCGSEDLLCDVCRGIRCF